MKSAEKRTKLIRPDPLFRLSRMGEEFVKNSFQGRRLVKLTSTPEKNRLCEACGNTGEYLFHHGHNLVFRLLKNTGREKGYLENSWTKYKGSRVDNSVLLFQSISHHRVLKVRIPEF